MMLFGIPSVLYVIIGIAFIGFAFTNPAKKNSTLIIGLVGLVLFGYGVLNLFGGGLPS